MHVSLNELDSVVQKAARGVDLPLGYGEDAGRLARRMAEFGVDATRPMAEALELLDAEGSLDPDVEKALTGHFAPVHREGTLSALWTAPALRDWLLVSAGQGAQPVAELGPVDVPLIVLFSCLEASAQLEVDLCFSRIGADGDELQACCRRGALHAQRATLAALAEPASWHLRIAPRTSGGTGSLAALATAGQPRENGIDVDAGVWRRLTRLAERCLVESTEQSRESGAGAGIIDTD